MKQGKKVGASVGKKGSFTGLKDIAYDNEMEMISEKDEEEDGLMG